MAERRIGDEPRQWPGEREREREVNEVDVSHHPEPRSHGKRP